MAVDQELQEKVKEMRTIEQNLQNVLLQKQAFQLEVNETKNAEEELKKTSGEVFRVLGQIMIKSNKTELEKELKEKKQLIDLRLKALEKQETTLTATLEKLRNDVLEKMK
ncbi:prefoldin subunit [Candidatus Pacearchaeota archaeon]|nr:prefoldin subunit [Candidatus Pacearchaeota archaeon]